MVASRIMVAALVGTVAVAAAFAMPAAGAPDLARHPAARADRGQIFFTPASADPKLAALIARNGLGGAPFRFTPADSRGARRIAIALPTTPIRTGEVSLRNQPVMPTVGVAPIAYSLGTTAPAPKRVVVTDLKVDLGTTPGLRRIVDIGGTIASGRKPKLKAIGETTHEEGRLAGSNMIDVGGSYSLSRNLDVTAGVRYKSQDRDRLAPLPDNQQRDSQAVYVGTAFRF